MPPVPALNGTNGEAAHATLSASGTYRWWACLASPRFEATFPDRESSVYAQEGTAAHALAQHCLTENIQASEKMDCVFEGFTVDLEMAENVQIYVDLCREYQDMPGAEWMAEKRFNLQSIDPPTPMFGTSDFVCLLRDQHKLVVIDLKYGKGIAVAVQDNPQLKYYALGVLLTYPLERIDVIETIIVQPRAPGHAIKRCEYDSIEILGWSVDLIAKARLTMEPDAPFTPGSHCRFCKGDGRCSAQAQAALAVAQIEFAEAVDPTAKLIPPDIDRLTPAQMSALLTKADVLDGFINGLRTAAHRLIENGEDIPGWKVVPRRPSRRWIDPDAMPATLEKAGLSEAVIWAKKLISVAQAEEHLTAVLREQGARAKDAKEEAKRAFAPLVVSASSGGVLAPDSDERKALPSRGEEFDTDEPPSRPAPPVVGTDFDFEARLPAK